MKDKIQKNTLRLTYLFKLLKINFLEFYTQFINIEHTHWVHNQKEKISKLKNIHQGEDCFIIGNGPSLNKIDLSSLKEYHTFGLNKIYLMFDKVDLNLSYHVAVNELVIDQSIEQFEQLKCKSFLSSFYSQKVKNLDHIFKIKTDGNISFCSDLNQPISEGYTVTYVAMQIAFYMGFKRIFLIGVDHNFNQKGDPNSLQILNNDDPNHFDPNYFKGNKWHLADLEGSEMAYNLAKFYFTRNQRQIFDATKDGKLTIFDKIEYEEALKIAKKKI